MAGTYKIYLATVENPEEWDTLEPVLVLFLHGPTQPAAHLTDPEIIGGDDARGVWA